MDVILTHTIQTKCTEYCTVVQYTTLYRIQYDIQGQITILICLLIYLYKVYKYMQ